MAKAEEQPGYRWVIVFIAALILAISMGSIVNGMAAFIVPMQESNGWARGNVSLINFAGIVGLAFGGMVIGRWADRRNTRPVVLFGVTALGLCYALAYFASALWQYYALFFIAGFFGAGAIFPTLMASVGSWFTSGTGVAIGIASAGQALGQGAVPYISSFLIKAFGVNGAFGVTGLFMLATLIPLSMLLRQPPEQSAQQKAATSSSAQPLLLPYRIVVIRMSIATILCCTCMSVPLMHLVPLIQDRGFALEQASSVMFVMMTVAILGRVSFGKLADIIGALPAYMLATAWMTALIFGFIYIDNLSSFYSYAVIYGFGYAGVMTGVLVTLTILTPTGRRASAMGIVIMFAWFGHAIGGYMGGALFDISGNYTGAYAVAAIAGVLNLIVVHSIYRESKGIKGSPIRLKLTKRI